MIQFLHSNWAILVLIMFAITISKAIFNYLKGKSFKYDTDFRLASFTLIALYIQIILGIINWFSSDYFTGIKNGQMGEFMKQAHSRLIIVEHPLMTLIALLLAHYGFKRVQKNPTSKKKFMSVIIFYGLAFLLILSRIPWSNWF